MVGIKNNRRTQYTIEMIKQSFLQLLESKKLAQITVTEICKQADINRGTFYLHYKDPYELFEKMQQEIIAEVLETLRVDQNPCTVDGSLGKLLNIIQEKRTLYRIMVLEGGEHNFLAEVLLEVHKDYMHRIEDSNHPKDRLITDYAYMYMVHGSLGIINHWLEHHGKESPTVIANLISSLTHTTIQHNQTPMIKTTS